MSPIWRPCGALFFMYLFCASAFLELILDSVVIEILIYNLYAFISRYVLWYLDDSVVYMHDLILAHIWLLDLCSYKSGVTKTHPSIQGKRCQPIRTHSSASHGSKDPQTHSTDLGQRRCIHDQPKGPLGSHLAKGYGSWLPGQVGRTTGSVEQGWAPPTYHLYVLALHSSSRSVPGEFNSFPSRATLHKVINMRGGAPNKDIPQVALSQVSLLFSP
jgi:hypothetical protein